MGKKIFVLAICLILAISMLLSACQKPVESQTYYIKYELDGGQNSNANPVNYSSGTNDLKIFSPEKEGYSFLGWTYEGQDEPVTELTLPSSEARNLTLYANWKANEFDITLDLNGGNGLTTEHTVAYGDKVNLGTPRNEEKIFKGWYVNGKRFDEERWHIDSDVTLVAEWYDFSELSVGDKVKYGVYDQDNNLINGKEEIDWIVLAVEDGKALLLSDKVLASKAFDTEGSQEWRDSSIRAWLNDNFLRAAFTAAESGNIILSSLENKENSIYHTGGTENTEDKVFLLSADEATKYVKPEFASPATTPYAWAQGNRYDTPMWWLRTAGDVHGDGVSKQAACYRPDLLLWGHIVVDDTYGVRPAIWVSTENQYSVK